MDPVTAAQPRHAGAVDGGVADDVSGAHQVGHAGLPGQLEVEDGGVLHRDGRPHLGEHVARGDPLGVDPQARADVGVDQLLDRRRPHPRRHLARRRQRHRGSRPGDGIDVGIIEPGRMHERDVLTQESLSRRGGDRAGPGPLRAGMGMDTHAHLPSRPPRAGDRAEIRGQDGPERDARQRSGEPGEVCRPAVGVQVMRGVHGAHPGIRVRLERGRLEAGVRSVVRPVDDRGDAGFDRTQQADQGGRVDVLRLDVIADRRRHLLPLRSTAPHRGSGTTRSRRDGACRRSRA